MDRISGWQIWPTWRKFVFVAEEAHHPQLTDPRQKEWDVDKGRIMLHKRGVINWIELFPSFLINLNKQGFSFCSPNQTAWNIYQTTLAQKNYFAWNDNCPGLKSWNGWSFSHFALKYEYGKVSKLFLCLLWENCIWGVRTIQKDISFNATSTPFVIIHVGLISIFRPGWAFPITIYKSAFTSLTLNFLFYPLQKILSSIPFITSIWWTVIKLHELYFILSLIPPFVGVQLLLNS